MPAGRRVLDAVIPPETRMRILRGYMRGFEWIAGSSSPRFWLTPYEWENTGLFRDIVKPGHVVFDLGAHVGYHSLLCARLGATVHACEPDPTNAHYLREHVALNQHRLTAPVHVHEVAIGAIAGTTTFTPNGEAGRVDIEGTLTVAQTSIDALITAHGQPNLIRMDIEGSEFAALDGARDWLRHGRGSWVIETHPPHYQAIRSRGSRAGWHVDTHHGVTVRFSRT